jgi:hypothetical protein
MLLTLGGVGWTQERHIRRQLTKVFLLAVAVQCVHFTEELFTGFHQELPELFGFAPMSIDFFVGFNLAWIAIWLVAALAYERGKRAALCPIWFLALAAVGNGIVHPLLALRAGSYFPGLVTSPIIGITGATVWAQLMKITKR